MTSTPRDDTLSNFPSWPSIYCPHQVAYMSANRSRINRAGDWGQTKMKLEDRTQHQEAKIPLRSFLCVCVCVPTKPTKQVNVCLCSSTVTSTRLRSSHGGEKICAARNAAEIVQGGGRKRCSTYLGADNMERWTCSPSRHWPPRHNRPAWCSACRRWAPSCPRRTPCWRWCTATKGWRHLSAQPDEREPGPPKPARRCRRTPRPPSCPQSWHPRAPPEWHNRPGRWPSGLTASLETSPSAFASPTQYKRPGEIWKTKIMLG